MKSSIKRAYIAATCFLVVALASTSWAQFSWQTGDVVVCHSGGQCNVLRITGGGLVFLNPLTDGLGGNTFGAAMDNTFHLLVTDDASVNPITGFSGSNIAKYTIASTTDGTTVLPHTVLHFFDASNGGASSGIRGLAVNSAGQMFVGNAGNGSNVLASIVQINQDRPGWLANTAYASGFTIIDPALHVQQVTTAGTSGSTQPTFNDNSSITTDNTVVWTDQGLTVGSFTLPNVTTPAWVANNPYAVNATVLDPNGHVQKVTAAGTSGPLLPPFNQFNGPTTDGLIWTDRGGQPGGASTNTWMPSTAYGGPGQPQFVIDTNVPAHVQQAQNSGTSGTITPAWNDGGTPGGTTPDNGIQWIDRGQATYQGGHQYHVTDTFFDGIDFQQATSAGTSGSTAPAFANVAGTQTPDNAVTWQDQGSPVNGSCIENQLSSLDLNTAGDTVYFTSAPGGIIQKVSTPISGSSSCTVFADFGPSITLHGIRVVPPNSMPGTCSSSAGSASCPNPNGGILVVATGTQFVDIDNDLPGSGEGADPAEFSSGQEIRDICTGQALTAAAAPPGPVATDSCALLLDGITGAIVARYPVGTDTTLQALVLDPLVTDCTGSGGTACNSAYTRAPKVNNFWLGDGASTSGMFFQVPFTKPNSGPGFTQYDANGACGPSATSCVDGIQSLAIYTGQGANQAGTASLFLGAVSLANPPTTNTQLVRFLNNSETVTVTNILASPATGLNLYVSNPDPTTCFDDHSVQCRPTTSTGNPLVWKVDVPVGSASPPQPLVAGKYASTVPGAIDTGTDVIYDTFTDITIGVGNSDPITPPKPPSWRDLEENTNNGVAEIDFGCTYLSPAPKCFKFPGTLPVKFTCNNLPASFSFKNFGLSTATPWGPRLQITEIPFVAPSIPNPTPIPACDVAADAPAQGGSAPAGQTTTPLDCVTQLPSSNKATTYRFDPTISSTAPNGFFVYNWSVPSKNRTYTITTYDDTHRARPTVEQNVLVKSSCP